MTSKPIVTRPLRLLASPISAKEGAALRLPPFLSSSKFRTMQLRKGKQKKKSAADCADCETKEAMLDHIESDLEFAGRLTQEQRSKLLEIAEKCPVHRTLVSEIDIRSRVL